MSTTAVIAVALAVALFFGWHAAAKVLDWLSMRRNDSIKGKIKHELDQSIKVGDIARIDQLKRRMCELDARK